MGFSVPKTLKTVKKGQVLSCLGGVAADPADSGRLFRLSYSRRALFASLEHT